MNPNIISFEKTAYSKFHHRGIYTPLRRTHGSIEQEAATRVNRRIAETRSSPVL